MLVATNTTVDENTFVSVGVEFVFYWCHEPDIETPATSRHHRLSPRFDGSTRNIFFLE